MRKSIYLTVVFLSVFAIKASTAYLSRPIPAFPGAEGFGSLTRGGRGGKVYIVSNLNDSGAGTLRECAEASGSRICVFRVAGTIVLNSQLDITQPFITIAGQTAPGGGITLKAADSNSDVHLQVKTHDVVIRYLRSRPGTRATNGRALSIGRGPASPNPVHDVVIDHTSLSWAGDELLIAWYATHDITMQWNIIAESLPGEEGDIGIKGPNLGETGGGKYSFHHNLVAHHVQRLPNISASGYPVDIVNNLIYNFGTIGSRVRNGAMVNYIGNYIKAGPNTRTSTYVSDDLNLDPAVNPTTRGFYIEGNYIQGDLDFLPPTSKTYAKPFGTDYITKTEAQTAYDQVLANAGAVHRLTCDGKFIVRRDPVDSRIIQSVRDTTRGHNLPVSQTFEQLGFISRPAEVGGWPQLNPGTPCPDSDNDGMPNEWEAKYFASTTGAFANTDTDGDGYHNIEEYLNGTNPKQADTTLRLYYQFLPLLFGR
jgi:pectate lyase